MTARTQSAPGCRVTGIAGARTPSLTRKAGTVTRILPHLRALWRQRHATRQRLDALEALTAQVPHRLDSLEADVVGFTAQMTADSILMGTSSTQIARLAPPEPAYGPPAGHPEAGPLPLGAEDDVTLTLMASGPDLWPDGEWEQIVKAHGEQR